MGLIPVVGRNPGVKARGYKRGLKALGYTDKGVPGGIWGDILALP